MTAYGSETTAVEAMKLGAFSYLTKPLDIDELKIVVSNAVQFVKMSDKVNYLSEELNKISVNDTIIAESTAMRRVLQLADKIKDTDTNVLITGESGTGKELIARRIHYNGLRKNERFVVINCAAIPENLLESELFGYKKGAFTGAAANHKGKFSQADNGTLFLDEIGDMQISLQAKILRALQERVIVPIGGYEGEKVNVRMIAATNRNLKEMVKEGLFREDLYYRLNVITIETPPLRNRRDDIIQPGTEKKYQGPFSYRGTVPDELRFPRECTSIGQYHGAGCHSDERQHNQFFGSLGRIKSDKKERGRT